MNWECKLAEAIPEEQSALGPKALEARNLCRQKKYGRALEVLWGMLRNARRTDSREREAFVLIHIGKVYRNWIWNLSLKFFKDGLRVAQDSGFKRGEMIAYNAMGELYYNWGKNEDALTCYQRSLDTASALHDASCQRDIILDMVDCYEAQGAFETCDQLLQEAVRLDEDLGAPSLKAARDELCVA